MHPECELKSGFLILTTVEYYQVWTEIASHQLVESEIGFSEHSKLVGLVHYRPYNSTTCHFLGFTGHTAPHRRFAIAAAAFQSSCRAVAIVFKGIMCYSLASNIVL